jgi:hypothetical protein
MSTGAYVTDKRSTTKSLFTLTFWSRPAKFLVADTQKE